MSKFLKSVLFWIIIFLWLFNFQTQTTNANNETTFIVTAYYSPLPNQKKYITWSYAWDKRLNWEWHTTASGKPVSIWVLAAPRKYPFWTKIYLEWFWVWSVEDRWWAIVKAWVRWHEHDRIDIWMWFWDEWLQRALKWWKKTVSGKVVSNNSKVNLKFKKWTKNYSLKEINPKVKIILEFPEIKLNWDNPQISEVKKVQELFKKLWLYSGKIDWDFKKIRRRLLDFQKEVKIIKYDNSWWAGYFWEKTKAALVTYFQSKDVKDIKTKKKITISDISYKQLDKVWKYLNKLKAKKTILKKLEKNVWKIKDLKNRKKIQYLIELLNK